MSLLCSIIAYCAHVYFIQVELIYNVVLISHVQQSGSYIFHILFHYGLSQDIEYSSLCINSCTLLFIQSIYNSLHLLIPSPSVPHSPSPLATTNLFPKSVGLFLFCI